MRKPIQDSTRSVKLSSLSLTYKQLAHDITKNQKKIEKSAK